MAAEHAFGAWFGIFHPLSPGWTQENRHMDRSGNNEHLPMLFDQISVLRSLHNLSLLADSFRTLFRTAPMILSKLRMLSADTRTIKQAITIGVETNVRAANEVCGDNEVLHSIHDNRSSLLHEI
ncbi:hypothetical protein EG328_002110 [Venturia inaequalis]|uniref:Uncharacterized protein n=1 Tax=Venturia inaequalis TaxID=5025 RepID=A0A8H3U2A4_VENIN|nr:hypothetical protein EG328_002110 [Venturia inaequalis]